MVIWENFLAIFLVILFLMYVLNLVGKKSLRVEFSICWVIVSIIILLGVIFNDLLLFVLELARQSGFFIWTMVVLIISMVFIIIDLSMSISKMKTAIKELTQEMAIMKFEEDENKTVK